MAETYLNNPQHSLEGAADIRRIAESVSDAVAKRARLDVAQQ
jgi:hypothetical protein